MTDAIPDIGPDPDAYMVVGRRRRGIRTKRKQAPRDQFIAGKPWPACYMTEGHFQEHVERLALHFDWHLVWHCRQPQRSRAGFPDLLLVKDRVLWRELKVRDMYGKAPKPTPAQAEFLSRLALAGQDAKTWTWPDDDAEIYEELSRHDRHDP